MKRFFWIRLRLLARQSRAAVAVMAAWFAFGTLAYHYWEGLPFPEALRNAFYLGNRPGPFWDLYSFWGQCVLFGIVIAVFVLQGLQQYNPQEGCRMLASEMSNHVIIIGYTHLGARLVEQLQRAQRPYVLIEQDPTAVDHLVRAGEPVIVDDAKQVTTLEQAGVARARLIAVTSNNVETALLVTKRVRESNPKAPIVVRCFLDEFTEILETLGATLVISSSKSAFGEIARYLGGVETS